MHPLAKLLFLLLLSPFALNAQNVETIPGSGELSMTFPSIYFKHNSTEYAVMPYNVDSCFNYMATKIKEINSYAIWRDAGEKERITIMRIKKLKTDLKNYASTNTIQFQSMGSAQKISKQTIDKLIDDKQRQYALTLNSVLDVSGAITNKNTIGKHKKQKRGLPRLVWCGWKYGFHWSSTGKTKKAKATT